MISGLGFAICLRLIDEFLHTRPHSVTLTLITTTRDQQKSDDTASRLQEHICAIARKAGKSVPGIERLLTRRISIVQELVDLNSLLSVRALAERLLTSRLHIDVLILNAGYGGWLGLNWPVTLWTIATDFTQALTWPPFKLGAKGLLAKSQLPKQRGEGGEASSEEPPLGEVFSANVFGHYMLVHWLMPILWRSNDARIVWLSSLEAYEYSFDIRDLQGITSLQAYESSKRLTDILVLSSELPETKVDFARFLENGRSKAVGMPLGERPKMYVCHPGIVATSIFPLPFILNLLMTAAFYLARLLGSMWHTCSAYKGACAPVWLALSPRSTMDGFEKREGQAKWGSAVDQFGEERAEPTEVDHWGYGGKVPNPTVKGSSRRGRRTGAKDVSHIDLRDFKTLAAACWEAMERLRLDWEERLGLSS